MKNSTPLSGHSSANHHYSIGPATHSRRKITVFLQDTDYELWNRVIDGPQYPMKKDFENNDVLKDKNEYGEVHLRCLKKCESLDIQICRLGTYLFKCISYTFSEHI